MYRLFIKIITYIVITSFLSQNVVWAEGNKCLAPDSREDLGEVSEQLGLRPDDAWMRFNGEKSRGRTFREMKFPAGINEDILKAFWDEYGNFGIIEGIIGGEEKEFVFDIHRQSGCRVADIKDIRKFDEIIRRLNNILSKLNLPPDTTIKLTTEGENPLLYHKDDKILELHAVLLTPEVDDATLEFIARHEERHFLVDGLEEWAEELLNIYMDLVYLQNMGAEADSIVNSLRILEGRDGYWRLLARRNEAQEKKFLIDVIEYAGEFPEFAEKEVKKKTGPLITLWNLANLSNPEVFSEAQGNEMPSLEQYFYIMAGVLLKDISMPKKWVDMENHIFKQIEESEEPLKIDSFGVDVNWAEIIVRKLWMERKIEVIMDGKNRRLYFSSDAVSDLVDRGQLEVGWDSVNRHVVYIPRELVNKQWARDMIIGGIVGLVWDTFFEGYVVKRKKAIEKEVEEQPEQRRLEFEIRKISELDKELKILENIYDIIRRVLETKKIDNNINIAIQMFHNGADSIGVCGALLQGVNLGTINQIGFSSYELRAVIHTIKQSRKILDIPFLPLKGTRREIQNYIDLLIQLSINSKGDPDLNILLLSILNKLKSLQDYEDLTSEDREYLEKMVLMIYAPLSEFLGLEDIADDFRDIWFKISNPSEYKKIKQEMAQVFNLGQQRYEDIQRLLGKVRKDLEKKLLIKGIKIRVRVKSVFSVREKLQNKGIEYPAIEDLKDLLGIQLIIPKTEIYENYQETIQDVLGDIFHSRGNIDHKQTLQYGYEEYDFIGETKDGLKIEVQIYPSEKDYRTYQVGLNAHWVYKLKRAYPGQEFDTDFLEKIQGRLTGNFREDFYTVYNSLSQWVFAGVVLRDRKDMRKDKVHIVRLPKGAIDADLASARRVNELDERFLGIRDITNAEQWCKELKPGVFKIEKGAYAEDRFKAIKKKSHRLRTHLLVSRILDSDLKGTGPKRGRGLLISAFQYLGYSAKYLDSTEGFDLLLSIAIDVGLSDIEEFYNLVYMINQLGEILWYGRVYQQLVNRLIGMKIPESIRDEDIKGLLEDAGIKITKKMDHRVILLAYLMTSQSRGKQILKDKGINYKDPKVEKRLELILPEYGLNNLGQLYARLGIDPDFIYSVLLRYSITGFPIIRFKVNEDISGIYDKILRIFDLEDIRYEDLAEERGLISILFFPPASFAVPAIARILDGIRDVKGVDRESVKYVSVSDESGNLIKKSIVIAVPQNQKERLLKIIAGLFAELKISFSLGRDKKLKKDIVEQELILSVPEQISVDILRDAVSDKLTRSGTKYSSVTVKDYNAGSVKGLFLFPLEISFDPIWLLYIGAAIALSYVIWRFVKWIRYIYKDWKLGRRIEELFCIWRNYDTEPIVDSELLAPFYEEVVDIPSGGEFDEIVKGLEIRRVERVITKVSDMAYYSTKLGIDLRFETQGYKVLGLYKGRLYQLLIVGEDCMGIGYHPGAKDTDTYYSLGEEITAVCGPVIMEKIRQYTARKGGKIPPIRRMIVIPMEGRQEFETFSRDSIFSRSILNRFPKTSHPLPSFTHNKYMLKMDRPEMVACYIPKARGDRGIIGRSFFRLSTGSDALHEVVHAIYDYDAELCAKVIKYFTRNPNKRLEEAIVEGYEYDATGDREHIINEEFAYTLSEFAAMARPWFSVSEMAGIRKEFDIRAISEIRDGLFKKLNEAEAVYGDMDKEVKAIQVEIGSVWNSYYREQISETEARQRYFELSIRLMNLLILPPVRLLDVEFFAKNRIIEPWMNPLELGYEERDLSGVVDTEYYLRVIEFLISRSRTEETYYKLLTTGEWFEAPYGETALIDARRLAWALIKINYGVGNLNELVDSEHELDRFYSAPSVFYIAERIAKAELGDSVYKKLAGNERIMDDRRKILGRFKRQINGLKIGGEGNILEELRSGANVSPAIGMKRLSVENPWLTQRFFEEAVLEDPRILLIDINAIKGLGRDDRDRLVRLINQVGGRVAVFSSAKNNSREVMRESCLLWQYYYRKIDSRAKTKFMNYVDNIYIRTDETEEEFAYKIYSEIQEEYNVNPENIMVFTDKDSFIRAWARIARKSLFYIFSGDRLYITSEDLLKMQILIGKNEFNFRPGEIIKLLPEYYYTEEALIELEHREAERGA